MKLTLTTAQAVSLAKGIAPAISTEPMKHNLHSIQVATTGESATFTATDGYRLHSITVPQTDIESLEPFQVGGVELVGALLGTAKAAGKGNGVIELVLRQEWVIATAAGVTMNVPVMNVEFPACATILDTLRDVTESGACYDTVYLAEIVTAAGHISGKAKKNVYDDSQLVKIENIHPKKPMHVTAQSVATGMQFHGVLMPRRAS
jgi:DNA polymerase III sliding clamp (beta) subunit (PCNA family)